MGHSDDLDPFSSNPKLVSYYSYLVMSIHPLTSFAEDIN